MPGVAGVGVGAHSSKSHEIGAPPQLSRPKSSLILCALQSTPQPEGVTALGMEVEQLELGWL